MIYDSLFDEEIFTGNISYFIVAESEKVLLLHLDDMKCNTVLEKAKTEPTRVETDANVVNSSLEDLEDTSSQSGHKCMICQVPPFDDAAALVEHVRLKHTVRCKYCGDKSESFQSRGYLMKHQQEIHPQIWKKIQEKKMRKKMGQGATTWPHHVAIPRAKSVTCQCRLFVQLF